MMWRVALAYLVTILMILSGGLAGFSVLEKWPIGTAPFWAMLEGAEFIGVEGVEFQMTPVECGPASLKMVLHAYGIDVSRSHLISQMIPGKSGVSMMDIKKAAAQNGLRGEGWRMRLADLQKVPLPAIALLRNHHFVVIHSLTPQGKIEILDPALGRLRFSPQRFEKVWSGNVLLFYKPDVSTRMR